jgi:nucleotide-binding universal stress UspA family protein
MNTIKKIVVGTDFNELAVAALRVSAGIAARTGAELVVVYADRFEPPAEFTTGQVKHIVETIERSKNRTREQLEHHVRKIVPDGIAWRAIVVDDLPASAIASIADAERADVIAVGTHGRGGLQRLIMGSVAETIIREAHVPVLTVRSAANAASIKRIVCAVNDTEISAMALDRATRLADALGAELTQLEVSAQGQEKSLDLDSDAYDLIVIGAEHKLVRDVTMFGGTTASITRHARTPVLIVTRQPVAVSRELHI